MSLSLNLYQLANNIFTRDGEELVVQQAGKIESDPYPIAGLYNGDIDIADLSNHNRRYLYCLSTVYTITVLERQALTSFAAQLSSIWGTITTCTAQLHNVNLSSPAPSSCTNYGVLFGIVQSLVADDKLLMRTLCPEERLVAALAR
jgi:hypothetical protein